MKAHNDPARKEAFAIKRHGNTHMKVEKLTGYKPSYPDKTAAKIGAFAAAAALAAGSLIGCKPRIDGDMQIDPGSIDESGAVVSPAPTDEFPEYMGEPVVDPNETQAAPPDYKGGITLDPNATSPCVGTAVPDDSDEPQWMGEVAFPDAEVTP